MATKNRSRKKASSSTRVTHKKKVRSQRGVSETRYGEIKRNATFSLTSEAINLIKNTSQDLDISASELLERFARSANQFKEDLRQSPAASDLSTDTSEVLHTS